MSFRQIHADDREALADLFTRMSPESRFRRYFTPKPRLTDSELAHLTGVDHLTQEAVAAIDESGRIIGIARYAQTERTDTVELAVEVADEHQGEGLGRALLTTIMLSATGRGYRRLVATILWENSPARALFGGLGFRAFRSGDGVVELQANGFAAMKKMATSTSTPSVTSAAM
jgi:L-amino acid N-acyltransferase YncA